MGSFKQKYDAELVIWTEDNLAVFSQMIAYEVTLGTHHLIFFWGGGGGEGFMSSGDIFS